MEPPWRGKLQLCNPCAVHLVNAVDYHRLHGPPNKAYDCSAYSCTCPHPRTFVVRTCPSSMQARRGFAPCNTSKRVAAGNCWLCTIRTTTFGSAVQAEQQATSVLTRLRLTRPFTQETAFDPPLLVQRASKLLQPVTMRMHANITTAVVHVPLPAARPPRQRPRPPSSSLPPWPAPWP